MGALSTQQVYEYSHLQGLAEQCFQGWLLHTSRHQQKRRDTLAQREQFLLSAHGRPWLAYTVCRKQKRLLVHASDEHFAKRIKGCALLSWRLGIVIRQEVCNAAQAAWQERI